MVKILTPDPRIVRGSIVRGNKYADYGITTEGTEWIVYDILGPLQEINREVPTAEYQDIKVGPKKLSTFIRFLEGVEPGVRQFDLQIFPVAAARFDYVGDEQEFIQQLSNKMFARFLKSK